MFLWSWTSLLAILTPPETLGRQDLAMNGRIFAREDTANVQIHGTGQSFDTVQSEMSRVGAIVGGILGGVCATLLALGIYALYHRRKMARHPEDGPDVISEHKPLGPSWTKRFRQARNKPRIPGSRINLSSEKLAPNPFADGWHPSGNVVIDISKPKPALRSPPNNFLNTSPDLPFFVVPSTNNSSKDSYTLPATAKDRGSRRKIEIPPQAVIIGPAIPEQTFKIRLPNARSAGEANKDSNTHRSLPRLSKILPPLPHPKSRNLTDSGGNQSGTRRPLPVAPDEAEHVPRRGAKQVAFAGVETIDGLYVGPQAPLMRDNRSSNATVGSTRSGVLLKQDIEDLRKQVRLLSKYVSVDEVKEEPPPPTYTYAL